MLGSYQSVEFKHLLFECLHLFSVVLALAFQCGAQIGFVLLGAFLSQLGALRALDLRFEFLFRLEQARA